MDKGFRFEFKGNFGNINSEEKSYIEYFIPYSVPLLKVFFGELAKILKCSNELYRQDVLTLIDIPKDNDSIFWIHNGNDGKLDELSLYDYYLDANSVYRMTLNNSDDYNGNISKECDNELFLRLFFKRAKIDLSLILCCGQLNSSDDINSSKDIDAIKIYASEINELYVLNLTDEDVLDLLINNKTELINLIYKSTNNYMNGEPAYDKLRALIKKHSLTRFMDEEGSRSCFAVMKCDDSKLGFFALSGYIDYSSSNPFVCDYIAKKEPKENILAIEKLAYDFHLVTGYTWARLCDNVLKYLNIDDNNIIEYLETPQSLGEKLSKSRKINGKDLYLYSCCERKILAACANCRIDNIKKFYIRWAPCEKCIPALLYRKGIKYIYACSKDYGEWEKKGFKGELKLWSKFL